MTILYKPAEPTIYPRTVADFQREHPTLAMGTDPSDQDLLPYGWRVVVSTAAPSPGANQTVQEILPEEVDGEWRQAWEVVDLPPPPLGPDWDGLANDMQNENGFTEYFVEMDSLNPFSTIAQVSRFDDWRRDGNWQPFLAALLAGMQALTPQRRALLAEEFLAASIARNMDEAFIAALEDAITHP